MNNSLLVCLIQGGLGGLAWTLILEWLLPGWGGILGADKLPALLMAVGAFALGFAALIVLAAASAFVWPFLSGLIPLLRRKARAARAEAEG